MLCCHSVAQPCPTLQTHGLQHARPPCPSPLPESTQTHVHRVSDAIQPSHPLSPPSPSALNLFQHQCLFQWDIRIVLPISRLKEEEPCGSWSVRVTWNIKSLFCQAGEHLEKDLEGWGLAKYSAAIKLSWLENCRIFKMNFVYVHFIQAAPAFYLFIYLSIFEI